jgi:hypothetical protein
VRHRPGEQAISRGQSEIRVRESAPEGHPAAFSTKRLPMTHITMPVSVRATRVRLLRIALFLGILVLCFAAAATRVEGCRTVEADFDARRFSSDFLIQPRTVCTTESFAAYGIGEFWGYLKGRYASRRA